MFDIFFYPIINSTKMNNKYTSIIVKSLIFSYWFFIIYIPLCIVLYNIKQREKNKIIQSSTYANLGLWCYLFTILVFLAYILLKVYHYTHNVLQCNNYILLGYFFFIFGILLYFIFYCIEMARYFNPKIYQTKEGEHYYKDIKKNDFYFSIIFAILNLSILFQIVLIGSLYWKPLFTFLKCLKIDINSFSNLRFQNEE